MRYVVIIEFKEQGDVKVSTGLRKMVKLFVCNASNGKLKINAEENLAYAA